MKSYTPNPNFWHRELNNTSLVPITYLVLAMNLDDAIDAAIDRAESGEMRVSEYYQALTAEQPELFTFLFDDDTRLLLEQEHDYVLFIAMILMEAMRQELGTLEEIEISMLEDRTEYNWGLLEHAPIETLSETTREHRAGPLYDFIEEACTPVDTHEILSEAACELAYVKLKSVVDVAYAES